MGSLRLHSCPCSSIASMREEITRKKSSERHEWSYTGLAVLAVPRLFSLCRLFLICPRCSFDTFFFVPNLRMINRRRLRAPDQRFRLLLHTPTNELGQTA